MNKDYILSLFDESIKTVAVSFDCLNSKLYTYKTRIEFDVGDSAIVIVGTEFKVVTICEVHDIPNIYKGSGIKYRWIVDKIDTTRYMQDVAKDEGLIRKIEMKEREYHRATAIAHLREVIPFIDTVFVEDEKKEN